MRRPLVAVALLALVAGVASAGDYHTGATLICSQCHTMHASLRHSYDPSSSSADPFGPFPQSWLPVAHLLKGGSENALCLTCHNGQPLTPDVYGTDTGLMLTNRSAGALNSQAGTVATGYEPWMGHSLDYTGTAPGTGTTNFDGLKCINCHHHHGHVSGGTTDVAGAAVTSSYRNLRAVGGKAVSYTTSSAFPTTARDVWIKSDGLSRYHNESVWLMEPADTDSGFGVWCASCHGDFHGTTGVGAGPEGFIRHPNAGVNIGALGGGHSSIGTYRSRAYRVRVMSAVDISTTQGQTYTSTDTTIPGTVTPTCLSCHKGHGNRQPFGLIYADGTGTPEAGVGENGAGNARSLCKQCHVQGGAT